MSTRCPPTPANPGVSSEALLAPYRLAGLLGSCGGDVVAMGWLFRPAPGVPNSFLPMTPDSGVPRRCTDDEVRELLGRASEMESEAKDLTAPADGPLCLSM